MAEAIAALGVIASVAQLADYGFKLSIKLYNFSETVYTADKSIKSISNDVSLTSTVLKELCQIIKSDDARVVSENAILATKQTVEECLKIFNDLDEALSKSLSNMGKLGIGDTEKQKKVKRGTATLERLKWPFKQSKMELLRSNLDRLKASLTLMLQVLSYARDVSSRKETETSMLYQKQMIESLARSERAMKRRYYALQHALEEQSSHGTFNAIINTAIRVPTREIDEEPQQNMSTSAIPSNPVGEILLCFRLLHDFLDSTATKTQAPAGNDEILDQALRSIERLELSKIGNQFGNQSMYFKVQAAQRIQERLKKIIKDQNPDGLVNSDGKEEKILIIYEEMHKTTRLVDTSVDKVLRHVEPGGLASSKSNAALNSSERENPPQYEDSYEQTDSIPFVDSIPFIQTEDAASETTKPDALQAEIDETAATMRANIDKVMQRGEYLDALQDHTDNIAVSTQFRRNANRVKEGVLTRAYRGVAKSITDFGSASYKSMQGLSGSLYETGKVLFAEPEEEEVDDQESYTNYAEEVSYTLDEDVDEDEKVLDTLLSQWTTLPAQKPS